MKQSLDGKVVLLGAASVGKTSIVNRAISDSFDYDHKPTVGAQYATKIVVTESGATTLRIWDTAGQERYRTLAPMYYQGCQVAIVVFSLTDLATLSDAESWVQELNEHFGDPPQIFLVGSKSDLVDLRAVDLDRAMNAATAFKATYFETSAKTGENIAELFLGIAEHLLRQEINDSTQEPIVTMKQRQNQTCAC
jgi:small GTP-binding protein